MYVLSKLSQATLKNPREVAKVAHQTRRYLRKTMDEGLWFRGGAATDLEVFSDSSYGQNSVDSQGTVIVRWAGGLAMWKAGRQSVPALSTAESELQEAIEGLVMGDSVTS